MLLSYHKVYPFKVNNSVGFSIFSILQASTLSNFRTFLSSQDEILYTLAVTLHSTLLPVPYLHTRVTINQLSFSNDLPVWGSLHKWNHIIDSLL